eukprot:2626074-Rhodomonas_salina.2
MAKRGSRAGGMADLDVGCAALCDSRHADPFHRVFAQRLFSWGCFCADDTQPRESKSQLPRAPSSELQGSGVRFRGGVRQPEEGLSRSRMFSLYTSRYVR